MRTHKEVKALIKKLESEREQHKGHDCVRFHDLTIHLFELYWIVKK